ncbi:MAG: methyltransferase [Polyangiales bacterium]
MVFDAKRPTSQHEEERFPFCVVDHFLSDLTQLTLLSAAFDLGLVELLEKRAPLSVAQIREQLDLDRRTHRLFIDGLVGMDVLREVEAGLTLTDRFRRALEYRDLMDVTIELGMMSARDVVSGLPTLVRDRRRYLEEAGLFRFFHYVPGESWTEDELEDTRRWVSAISTLTRYESQIVLAAHDFRKYRRVLDVGGNSGELVRQICGAIHQIEGTVIDLPIVCEVGRRMTEGHAAQERIRFVGTDVREQSFPAGQDLVVFKSVLHDWDKSVAQRLIERARACLAPGGCVMVVEKRPVDFRGHDRWSDRLMWFPYYAWRRAPQRYARMMEQAGLTDVRIDADLPRELSIVTAQREG